MEKYVCMYDTMQLVSLQDYIAVEDEFEMEFQK